MIDVDQLCDYLSEDCETFNLTRAEADYILEAINYYEGRNA